MGYGILGFYRLAHYASKHMNISDKAHHRYRALKFFESHGLPATLDAFDLSERTLRSWKAAFNKHGLSGLEPKSTAPKHRRRRNWDIRVIKRIRYYREELPNLGKEQVHIKLKPWCKRQHLKCPSVSTIGRLIDDTPDKMRVSPVSLTPKGKVKKRRKSTVTRRPKGYKPKELGELVGLDCIERRLGNLKRFIITYIDEYSGYALALAVPHLNSSLTKAFFESAIKLTPFSITKIITDNGSEFKGAFDAMIVEAGIKHLWTYPSTPKMNAKCERFNRTLQEQFVDFNELLLFDDLALFNERMADYLVLYNSQRPHKGLKLKTSHHRKQSKLQ